MTHVQETCDKCGVRYTDGTSPRSFWIIPKQEGVGEELYLCEKCGKKFKEVKYSL